MTTEIHDEVGLEAIERLSQDIRAAASTLTADEARYLVSMYYDTQEQRIRVRAQERTAAEQGEPNMLVSYMAEQYTALENNAKRALQAYAEASEVGRWSMSISGIGPVLAAGLLAHINIEKAPTVGAVWRFAGLDPTVRWGKKEKRPWNADLKVLCWKIGESFVKVSTRDHDVYGHIYAIRKVQEETRNAAHEFSEQAAETLATKNFKSETVSRSRYEAGELPQARIHARAQRYAVKLFLSAWHEAAYVSRYGVLPPKPYALAHMDHVHYIAPPNMHMIEGWEDLHHAADWRHGA